MGSVLHSGMIDTIIFGALRRRARKPPRARAGTVELRTLARAPRADALARARAQTWTTACTRETAAYATWCTRTYWVRREARKALWLETLNRLPHTDYMRDVLHLPEETCEALCTATYHTNGTTFAGLVVRAQLHCAPHVCVRSSCAAQHSH